MAMEGTQSLHNGSLSEVQHSQSSPPPGNERTTHTRFLLSNAEAGSVIGRGGSTVNDFQSQSGARIQLSRNFEYFPGTADRVAMVSGTVNDTLKAIDLILTKLLDEFYVEDGAEVEPQSKIRLIVPNGSCGGIIGKGGAIIKSLIEDSQTGIKISPQDDIHPGLHDRIVTVTGTLGGQMRAIELILLKLVEDPYYQQSASAPFPYAVAYNGMNYGPNGVGGNYQNNGVQNQEDENSSTTIGVADEHIGLVVGRGGRTLTEISQLSGARIKISDRGDFMVGTSDRKVTITGPQRAIHIAESMIARKVASVSER